MLIRLFALAFLASCSAMKGTKVVAVTINDECKYPIAKIVDTYYNIDGVVKIDSSQYKSDRMYRSHVVYLQYESELFLIPLEIIKNKTAKFGCAVTEVRKVYG